MTSAASKFDAHGRQAFTPERVRKTEFSRAPLARRGYNEDEVELFRTRVADAIAHADAEKGKLRAEIERMRDYFRQHGVMVDSSDEGASNRSADVASINAMSRAQQSADAQIAQAEDYARRIVTQARQQYEEILQQGQEQAAEAAEQARRAQEASRDSQGRGSDADGHEREQLERHIAYLRTFAEVTQVQLKSVLEGLTREVDKLESMPTQVGSRE